MPRRASFLTALPVAAALSCGTSAPREHAATTQEAVDTTFRGPQRVTISGYSGDAMEPFLTRDGRFLLFNNRNDPPEKTDLHLARARDGLTFEYIGPLRGANSGALDGVPTVDHTGTLYFVSTRSYGVTGATIHRAQLVAGVVSGVMLVDGLPRERGVVHFDVEVSADGAALYYARGTFRGGPVPTTADLAVAVRRGSAFEPWPQGATVLANVNTRTALEYAAAISADDRELFFTRLRGRESGIYRATRASANEPFGGPMRITAIRGFAEAPAVVPDGRHLYYHALSGRQFAIFRVSRGPNQ